MAKPTIMVVDDEEDILELLEYNLSREGYEVICAATGEDALAIADSQTPGLVILDLMLPGVDGLEVCQRLKANSKTEQIPVIMLTAKGEEADIVAGLELGADDYVAKPFSPKVLIARIRTVLRRKSRQQPGDKAIKAHDITIDPSRHEVMVLGQPIALTFTEFRILHTLVKRPGRVFTRNQIMDAIHGTGYVVSDRAIDVQIAGLRKKLGPCGNYVQTVRGVGYRFKD